MHIRSCKSGSANPKENKEYYYCTKKERNWEWDYRKSVSGSNDEAEETNKTNALTLKGYAGASGSVTLQGASGSLTDLQDLHDDSKIDISTASLSITGTVSKSDLTTANTFTNKTVTVANTFSGSYDDMTAIYAVRQSESVSGVDGVDISTAAITLTGTINLSKTKRSSC